jgi:hypothetical protein
MAMTGSSSPRPWSPRGDEECPEVESGRSCPDFIETVPVDKATGATAELYDGEREAFGDLPNFTRAFRFDPMYTPRGVN